MILLDTSGLLSALDQSQRRHSQCASVLLEATPPLLLSPFVLAELDYLLMRHIGSRAQSSLLEEIARGAYLLQPFDSTDIKRAKQVMEKYADLEIGLADASIVVLAERYDLPDVLTLDERHFRALRFHTRRRFKLLPADD